MSFINTLEILSDLTQEEKDQLSLFSQEKTLNVGEVLFNEGDDGIAMYFLKSGIIDISRKIDGEDIILGEVHAEEVIGEMALFGESKVRMATAVAKENCELITILSFSIKDLTKKYPELLGKIKEIIEGREVSNNKMIDGEK